MNPPFLLPIIVSSIFTLFTVSCNPPEAQYTKPVSIKNQPSIKGDGTSQLISFINSERARQNKPILTPHPLLKLAAKSHSVSMHQNNFFSHKGLNGETFRTRLMKSGYKRSFAAENLAKTDHPSRAFQMWQNSSSHKANMMNKTYNRVGVHREGRYWTALFASN